MKKRVRIVSIAFISVTLIVFTIFVAVFMNNTINAKNIKQYCIDNTTIGATSFIRREVESEPLYAFWISENSSTNRQEIFIFKKAKFGFIDIPNRFSFIHSSSSSEGEIIGSIMFMPRDNKNKKKNTNLLVLYSSNPNRITHYILKLDENGKEYISNENLTTEQPFIVSIPNLGVDDCVIRQFISISFYNDKGELVETKQ